MNTKDFVYSWHLSLRVDRPIEGCPLKPHAYMYGKKLESKKDSSNSHQCNKEPPPPHDFTYRWFRGPMTESCAYQSCVRRHSFSPHDWSQHALGQDCALQCVSAQSSLYRSVFCNRQCFQHAWKTQFTMRRSRSGSFASDDGRSSGSRSPAFDATPPRGHLGAYASEDLEWQEISHENVYLPGPDDVGHKLKMEASAYAKDTGEQLMSRVITTDIVLSRAPEPVPRPFVHTKASGSGARFRVATYNTLSEIYATQQQYPYCDFWALSWDFRFQNILREILDATPDVVCLQEIQADHYESHVYAALSEAGYEGVYKQKTRQSMGLAGKVDGCAVFWNRNKFHMAESYSIEFNEVAQRQATQVLGLNLRSDEGIAFVNRLSKDNIAQLVVLELIQSRGREINQLCVANTHLYSNKDFPDVKLWQSWQLLQELESFILSRGQNLPLIICGDFNSTPDTAVYDLMTRQQVHPGHPDVNVATGDDVPNVLPDAMNITHSFQLGSAYQTVMGDEPWVTNYTAHFKGTLDYIWYSAQNLRPISVAPIPDEAQLTKNGEALPSTEFSSDHIMLISDMQFVNNR